jgi:hypothetical protein
MRGSYHMIHVINDAVYLSKEDEPADPARWKRFNEISLRWLRVLVYGPEQPKLSRRCRPP